MPTYIYGLVDPRTSLIAYVGKSNDVYARWEQHISDTTNAAKTAWVRQLMASGIAPIVVILETVDDYGDWDTAERWWIAQGIRTGWPLLNQTHVSPMSRPHPVKDRTPTEAAEDVPELRPAMAYALPSALPHVTDIKIKPTEQVSLVYVEGVPIDDVLAFIDGLPHRGHSARGWTGYRFPSGALCDTLYWRRVSRILRKGGVIYGCEPRKSGKLLIKDPEAIKRHLGLTSVVDTPVQSDTA